MCGSVYSYVYGIRIFICAKYILNASKVVRWQILDVWISSCNYWSIYVRTADNVDEYLVTFREYSYMQCRLYQICVEMQKMF